MQLSVTGHHVEITPALRAYVEKKLERIMRHFDHVIDVHCVLTVEKLRQTAEATLHVSGSAIHANDVKRNMYAAIDGLARIGSRIRDGHSRNRTIASLAGICVLFAALLPGHQPLWRLFSGKLYRFGPIEQGSREALSLIPADASVVAQTCIAPHLSHRNALFPLDTLAPDADYVIAVDERSPWPVSTLGEIRLLLAERQRHGYVVLFDRDGWVVLSRTRRP